MQMEHSKVLNIVFLSSLLIVFLGSFFRYYYLKEFLVQIEIPCDPIVELCYERDCSIEDECPPNELSNYRLFEMSGSDFSQCDERDSCEDVCKNSNSTCIEIVCDSNEYVCQGQE